MAQLWLSSESLSFLTDPPRKHRDLQSSPPHPTPPHKHTESYTKESGSRPLTKVLAAPLVSPGPLPLPFNGFPKGAESFSLSPRAPVCLNKLINVVALMGVRCLSGPSQTRRCQSGGQRDINPSLTECLQQREQAAAKLNIPLEEERIQIR